MQILMVILLFPNFYSAARLNDPKFLEHAGPELIEEKKADLKSALAQKDVLEAGLRLLNG